MNAVLLISIFLVVIATLGILSKGDIELEGECSAFPPKIKIKLKNRKGKTEKAKKKT